MTCGTLTLHQASKVTWDVAVIGAGPAGTVAALQAARRGWRTLLLDKARFPRNKVCGGCLNHEALTTLHGLGLKKPLAALGGHPLDRFTLWANARRLCLELPRGLAVSRSRLDATLAEATIAAGAHFLPGTHVQLAPELRGPNVRTLECRQEGQTVLLEAKVVVVASGLSGDPLRAYPQFTPRQTADARMGVQAVLPAEGEWQPGTIYMAVGRAGYVGLTVLEDDRVNLAAAVDRAAVRQSGIAGVCQGVIDESGISLATRLPDRPWLGTTGLTRRRACLAAEGVFVVGDAAGYVEPFTGEGMAAAIRSGRAVGPFVERALAGWSPQLGNEWNRTMHQLVTRRQWVCEGLRQILRKPVLTRAAIQMASCLPGVGRAVVRMI